MSNSYKVEAAGCDPAASGQDPKTNLDRKDRECLYVFYHTTNIQICQSPDDVLTLEDALDVAWEDTQSWVEMRVMGGYMTPRWARDNYGYCSQWLADYAIERYSMAAAEVGL